MDVFFTHLGTGEFDRNRSGTSPDIEFDALVRSRTTWRNTPLLAITSPYVSVVCGAYDVVVNDKNLATSS